MNRKSILSIMAALSVGFAFADDESAGLPPAFVWKPIPGLVWRTTGSAKVENGVLTATLEKVGNAYAEAEVDLSAYDGKPFEISAIVKAEGIADAQKSYLGYRFAVNYLDMSMGGNRSWPNGPAVVGDFGPGESVFVDRSEKKRRKAFIQIGICYARGKVTCDLSTLRIREPQPLVPKRNAGYKVKYPDRVKNLPRMRGVMLGGMGGDGWDNLQSWGANLVRYQFHIPGTGPATNFEAYAEGFRRNTEKELDNITRTLDDAKAHGMMVVIDAHYACGGMCSKELGDPLAWSGDWRIFHDKRFAKLFAWSWQRIAERCRGRTDVVYGYDLMNEAHHNAPAVAGCDLVGLQEKIAKAIRAIDPDTPIVVESMYCDPGWFRSLSAIGLDNVIYQVHLYYPHDYTHQGILNSLDTVHDWPDPARGWNREFLKRSLKPVIDFQKEHDAKMFVGEFSAIAWAPNAEGYIRDCIAIFEELGWDWTYHAYREFDGWSVEKEAISRGMPSNHFRPSTDNPRKRVLLQGLRGEIVPGKPAFGRLTADEPRLRFGVLGDVHIDQRHFGEPGGGHSVEVFRTALRCLGARAVDGVVIAGDLTQDGAIAELKRLAETWREVFPDDRRADGGHVERLFAFGDHDVEKPYAILKFSPELFKDPKVVADLTANHIAYVDRAKVWKDVFGEDFAPIMRKTVKGYDFVLAHLVNLDEDGMRYADPLHIPGLEKFFATNTFDRTKPLFYAQHKIPRGTVGGKYQSGQDSGRTTAVLSRYPNAVGFNGHKHRTATEELSLWQGAFTQIQAPGLATLLTAAGRENSRCSCEAPCSTPPQQMEPLDTRLDGSHALVVSVYGDRLTVERIDVLHGGEPVAEPWVVPWPNDGRAAYEARGKAAGAPQFAAGTKVAVAKRLGKDRAGVVTNQVVVSFPPAASTKATPRAYDYEVTAVLSKGVVSRIVSQKRVYSPKCYWPERYDTNDVVCVFGRNEIPDNHESVKFVVRPMNAWGKAGEPIESAPDEYWSKGPLYPF